MPASCVYDDAATMVTSTPYNPNPQQSLEDQRTLTLALELMNSDDILSQMGMGSFEDPNLMATMSEAERANKRSQNMTECVTVPSSEHVAEIVGRQGCKIKALRAKTNTYIKTPVRGEEPIFVVTGRKEDVANARREILSAADHFSQIRACRKNNLNGSMAPGPPVNVPGQVTISVRVPYRVVGLVVGPKGATIKRIQQQTQTYIVTPSRDKEPVFEVTGLPDNVETAKKEIEAHIAMRTGSMFEDDTMATIAASHNITLETLLANPELLNCYRSTHSNLLGNGSTNGLGTTSLNAMLSNNAPSHSLSSLSLGGMLHGNQFPANFNSHVSGNSNSLSNGHAGLQQSLSNGVGNGPFNSPALNMLNGVNGRGNNLLGGLGEISLSALSNAMSLNSAYNGSLENQQSASSNNHFDMSSFSVLGETANNLLNASKNPGLDAVASTRSILNGFRSNPSTDFSSMGSVLPNSVGGVDEGLGSLESSMGSSPALDQPQSMSSNIWSESRFPNPLPFYGSRNGFSSGEHTPSTRLSPNRLLSHETAHRSLSDPSPHMESLSNALSRLGAGNALYRRSNSSSPELGDLPQNQLVSSLASSSSASLFPTSSATSTSSMASSAAVSTDMSALLAGLSKVTGNDSEAGLSSGNLGSRRGSVDSAPASGSKVCNNCQENSNDAVFFPCGHNQFCVECAEKIQKADGVCPSCQSKIERALQIRP